MFLGPVSGFPGNGALHTHIKYTHINLLLYFGLHKDYSTIHARPQTFIGSIERQRHYCCGLFTAVYIIWRSPMIIVVIYRSV